ncbi:MAG TPA: methyltransferase domain-containing protein [Noviherbaspirillum sp.]|nr:methyltransferase domain-containing protein [Noviherbaspirillum sp.]
MRKHKQTALQALAEQVEMANVALAQHHLCEAEHLYRQIIAHAPNIPEVHNNLGTVLKEQGRLAEAHATFERALALRPDYASAHSNLLFTLQYAPGQTLAGLRAAHEDWARRQLHGITPAGPASLARTSDGPLVVGLVSPDLYAHPVGVFLLPWLEKHNRGAFRLIAYAESERDDPIARRIRAAVAHWRTISGRDDEAVAKQMAEDQVDILIDLAGHTAGNRLKLFARRAAPIQMNWLGYSATTGVPAMDVVLVDAYTVPPGVEEGFTEQLVRLDGLRFCYTRPEYAPAVSPAPILQKGYVTFGSFNNLAKITPEVIETWAAILKAVSNGRLVLKWKSLGDAETRNRLIAAFTQHGVDGIRIECRGWSSHPQMLAEYGDIDIALDPFPFSGGLTSCDALFMGVPVLTLPGELPISRQTGSFLEALGLPDWIATTRDEYIDKAVILAKRADLLSTFRRTLRKTLLNSRLCDGMAYARAIETALSALHADRRLTTHSKNKDTTMKTFLHIGCGPKRKDRTTAGFNTDAWTELRLDIDERVNPDIVGTMTDISSVADASVDAIFSSHNIEHLYPHEVPLALAEFWRVLKPEGFVVITCPDLQEVCRLVAEDKLTDPAYTSPAGPITPLDIVYGHRPAMAKGNLFMAHRCGFTQKVLGGTLHSAGFAKVAIKRRPHPSYDLWAIATKADMDDAALRALAGEHFPR